jgi:hypothetical protein
VTEGLKATASDKLCHWHVALPEDGVLAPKHAGASYLTLIFD